MQKQAELYRGKAKTVYSTENPDLLVLEFRNDTSAGDGARIEQFDRKGMVNNKFNHFIMTKLAEAGIPTQMEALLSDTECLVKKLDMVPVECVIRNRAAGSLVKRLGIEEGIELNPPLFDLFLKNDAMHDPMVNESYCETFGWVSKENLARMQELTYKANDVLKKLFDDAGLILVDFKLEFGITNDGQLVLADEINRATPKTQSALLEAMQEHTVTGGSQTYRLEEPFFVLATQNPLETEGTYPLPEAQMDRFLFKLDVAFPNKEELMKIVLTTTDGKVHRASKVMDGKRLLQMREIAQQVPVAEPVAEYLMDLILKTHPENPEAPEVVRQYVRYGASPRGAQAVLQAARIFALLAGRYHVAYEDIKQAAKPALRHRIFLNFEGMAEGKTSDEIIEALY